jgi:hypothetical protein
MKTLHLMQEEFLLDDTTSPYWSTKESMSDILMRMLGTTTFCSMQQLI